MSPHSLMSRSASVLTVVGIVLVIANWFTRPEEALVWTAVLAMFAVMIAVRRLAPRAVRRFATEATATRNLDQITTSVIFAAVMLDVALALTLGRTYGLIDASDAIRRSTGVLMGVFVAMLGNAMPKNLPPLSSGYDEARQREFHRLAGWTWALGGLALAIGWVALPTDQAETASIVVMGTALMATVVHLVRLARRARTSA